MSTVLHFLRTFPFIFPGSRGIRVFGFWNFEFAHAKGFQKFSDLDAEQKYWAETETKMFLPLKNQMDSAVFWGHVISTEERLLLTPMAQNLIQGVVEAFFIQMVDSLQKFQKELSLDNISDFSVTPEMLELFLDVRNLRFLLPHHFTSVPEFTIRPLVNVNQIPVVYKLAENAGQRVFGNPKNPFSGATVAATKLNQCPITAANAREISFVVGPGSHKKSEIPENPMDFPVLPDFTHSNHFPAAPHLVSQLKHKTKLLYLPPENFVIRGTEPYPFLIFAQSRINSWIKDAVQISRHHKRKVNVKELLAAWLLRGYN